MQLNTRSEQIFGRVRHWSISIDLCSVIAIGICAGLLVLTTSNTPFKLFIGILGLVFTLFAIVKIEWGLLALVFITYSHLSAVLTSNFGVHGVINGLTGILILGIFLRYFSHIKWPTGWERLAILLLLYGLLGLSSLLYAVDIDRTKAALFLYMKSSVLALIVIIILREANQLRAIIWMLLLAAIFLGTLNCYQYLTSSFDNDYWGFCRVDLGDIVGETKGYRIGGPLGATNFFAQIMLVPIPLALNRLWKEQHVFLRLLAAWAFLVSIFSMIFTFSRGGTIGLLSMLIVYMIFHPPRLKNVFIFFALLLPVVQFSSASYFERMMSLQDLLPGVGHGIESDSSFKGRTSEMLVALHLFAEHPIRGNGLGNYSANYKKYANKVFLDFRQEERKAHCRYLEIMAETGLLGITVFVIMLWLMFRGLLEAQRKANQYGMEELEEITIAFSISLVGFLTTYIFLHGDFQRYFWLLIGIGYAIPHIVNHELAQQKETCPDLALETGH